MYIFTQMLDYKQELMTKVSFFKQSFPSKLVALPSLENPICFDIYPELRKRWINAFLQGISTNWNASSFI